MVPLRAILDRLILALAVLFGVDLPPSVDSIVALALVGMAAMDGWLRWRERAAVRELLSRAEIPEADDLDALLGRARQRR